MLSSKMEDRDWKMESFLISRVPMLNDYKKLLAAAVVVSALVVAACSTDSSNAEIPVPTATMANASGEPLDTLGKGYSLFQVHCAQCHELKMPRDMRVDEWHAIVPGMAWNAGMKKEDEHALLAYLVAATRQIKQSE